MRILITGSGAKEYTLAKMMKNCENIDLVFVAPGNDAISEIANCVDIKADNVDELLEFAKANEIDMTVACSEKSVINGIADKFNDAGLMIFAPSIEAARICTSKSAAKKFMYKTKIPTPKFGVFDRENMAVEYARKSRMPIVIKSDNHMHGENAVVCDSFKEAKRVIEEAFGSFQKKIVIEDFIDGQEFSYYIITDGFNALPLNSVVPYKYSLNGDGGLINSGVGAYAPYYMLDNTIERKLFKEVIYPALDELSKNGNSYVGILGVDVIIDRDGNINVLEFNSFLQEPDAQCVLGLLNENIFYLMRSAIIGTLIDLYPEIKVLPQYAASVVLNAGNYPVSSRGGELIYGLENIEDDVETAQFKTIKQADGTYKTTGGRTLVLTAVGATLSSAVEKVYENVDLISFEGKKYRTDIGKRLILG